MSLFSVDPTHFTRWLFDNNWLPDAESIDPLGRCYVAKKRVRRLYRGCAWANRARSATRASLRHRQTRAVALALRERGIPRRTCEWSLSSGRSGRDLHRPCAWRALSCLERTQPGIPGLSPIPGPPSSLAAVNQSDSVLIVGTGLTMVDVVATLCADGIIKAPLSPFRHAWPACPATMASLSIAIDLFEGARPTTALELLRLLRATVRQRDGELDWQSIVDALRRRLPEIWPTLLPPERLRVVRRLLPFWEVHRFRAAPQGAAAVARLPAQGTLTVQRARVIEVDAQKRIACRRASGFPDGTIGEHAFDTVILCSGASRNIRDNPLLDSLVDQGLAQADDVELRRSGWTSSAE